MMEKIRSKWKFLIAKNAQNVCEKQQQNLLCKYKQKYVYVGLGKLSACYSSPPTCHTEEWK